MNLFGILEGILFVVGDEGITLTDICSIMSISLDEAKDLLMELRKEYENENRGVRISFLGDAFKLTTKSEHKEYYQKLIETPGTNNLSQAALETLAIIAYNQPITRLEVDTLRGVNSSQMIRKLVAKGFLKEAGKASTPGRPNIYKTTSYFLDFFCLATISDLPQIENTQKITEEETELFSSMYKEEN